jgi:hypothetical protein
VPWATSSRKSGWNSKARPMAKRGVMQPTLTPKLGEKNDAQAGPARRLRAEGAHSRGP